LNIGIPKETFPDERRVAIIPAVIPKLTAAGFTVVLEEGAGRQAGFMIRIIRPEVRLLLPIDAQYSAKVITSFKCTL